MKLESDQIIYLDTPVFDHFWTPNSKYQLKLVSFFDAIYERKIQCIISYLSYIDLISRYMAQSLKLAAKLRGFLTNSDNIVLYPCDQTVSDRAARYCNYQSIELVDAAKIATAEICGVDTAITDNPQWKQIKTINVVLVKEL